MFKDLRAAVFVGGMEGIVEEFRLAREARVEAFLVTGPGGATRHLDEADAGMPGVRVLDGAKYPSIAAQVATALALRAAPDADPDVDA
jgi:hypothetical protein